jgi:hypothetical protein
LCRHLLLCSTDEWSGLRRNRNLHKTQLNLGLNPAPEALWPRVQINHCALGSLYISLLKIHDCWSQFLCLMSKRTHTHIHTWKCAVKRSVGYNCLGSTYIYFFYHHCERYTTYT